MAEEIEVGPNVAAVRRDLDALAEREPDLGECGLAQMALTLARGLDNDRNSLTSKAMASKALSDTLAELRELAPDEIKKDGVDGIKGTRKKRRQGKAKAKG